MKKYFLSSNISTLNISPEKIDAYRTAVVHEMRKMGATNQKESLLCQETILNSLQRNRKPEDVAWAILQ